MVVPVALDEKADKSKLRITSLGIPLHLAYHPVKQMTPFVERLFRLYDGCQLHLQRTPK